MVKALLATCRLQCSAGKDPASGEHSDTPRLDNHLDAHLGVVASWSPNFKILQRKHTLLGLASLLHIFADDPHFGFQLHIKLLRDRFLNQVNHGHIISGCCPT